MTSVKNVECGAEEEKVRPGARDLSIFAGARAELGAASCGEPEGCGSSLQSTSILIVFPERNGGKKSNVDVMTFTPSDFRVASSSTTPLDPSPPDRRMSDPYLSVIRPESVLQHENRGS